MHALYSTAVWRSRHITRATVHSCLPIETWPIQNNQNSVILRENKKLRTLIITSDQFRTDSQSPNLRRASDLFARCIASAPLLRQPPLFPAIPAAALTTSTFHLPYVSPSRLALPVSPFAPSLYISVYISLAHLAHSPASLPSPTLHPYCTVCYGILLKYSSTQYRPS